MEKPHEIENGALWTDVASAAWDCSPESHSQQPKELYIIKHTRSKDYFSYGHWTYDAAEAQAFQSRDIALSVVQQCGLCNVELEQQPATA